MSTSCRCIFLQESIVIPLSSVSSLVYLPTWGHNKIRQSTQGANNIGMTKFCVTLQGIEISKLKGSFCINSHTRNADIFCRHELTSLFYLSFFHIHECFFLGHESFNYLLQLHTFYTFWTLSKDRNVSLLDATRDYGRTFPRHKRYFKLLIPVGLRSSYR